VNNDLTSIRYQAPGSLRRSSRRFELYGTTIATIGSSAGCIRRIA